MRITSPRRTGAAALAAGVALALLSPALPALAVDSASDPTPERIVLTPAADASTAQSFTWRTGADITVGRVEIRAVGAETWRTVDATANEVLDSGGIDTRTHSATVDGLTPSTEYEYRVGTDGAMSDSYRFTTAGAPGDPFTFIYFGDAQNQIAEKWAPVVQQAYDRYPDAVGTVNAGDLVNTSGDDSEWTEWFGAMDGYSQTTNVIAAPGNHEYSGDAFLKNWKSNFEYPFNGPESSGGPDGTPAERQRAAYLEHMAEVIAETVYYTDYQGVRFISLNASRSQAGQLFTPDDLPPCYLRCPNPTELWLELQASWLEQVLDTNPNKWAVAVFHQPVFSTAVGRDESDLRAAWLPVFQNSDIDLVLMGHDHTYARGYVDADATSTPGVTTGPVYTVAVAGPKYYELQPHDDNVWTRNGATQVTWAGHTSTFQGITVDGDTLRYESIVAAKWDGESSTDVEIGGVLDSFTITKYDSGEKYVTEDGVPIPPEGSSEPELPNTPEVPAEEPADVPLGHDLLAGLDATVSVPGAATVDPRTGIVYLADQSEDGVGTIQAIDPGTGEILDSFDAGSPVGDLSYDAAFNGVLAVLGDKLGSFLTEPGSFGDPYYPLIPAGGPVISLQYDAVAELIFVAFAGGTVVSLSLDDLEPVGSFELGANLQRIRIDDASGVLYATFANEADGEVGLRMYATREAMAVIEEFALDAGAGPFDVDVAAALAYVGHSSGEGGVSIVDLATGDVVRLSGAEYGGPLGGVGVDPVRGVAYLASTAADPSAIVPIGRHQAPRIVASPASVRADAGEPIAFEAAAIGRPSPTVAWQSRAPGGEWTWIDGATATRLETIAETDRTLYRAVFSSTIGGIDYSTASASATLVLRDAGGPGGPGDPGDPPTTTPPWIDESLLTPSTAGGVTATRDGDRILIQVPGHDAEWLGVYLHSDPRFLGWRFSDEDGRLSVTAPAGTTGSHRIVVLDAEGGLLGWAAVDFPAPGLATTGTTTTAPGLAAALTLLLLGAAAVLARRRARVSR